MVFTQLDKDCSCFGICYCYGPALGYFDVLPDAINLLANGLELSGDGINVTNSSRRFSVHLHPPQIQNRKYVDVGFMNMIHGYRCLYSTANNTGDSSARILL